MMRIKEAIERRKLIHKMNDEWEDKNIEICKSSCPLASEENSSVSSVESDIAMWQFAQQLEKRMTLLQKRALRITWKRLSGAPRTSGRGTIPIMEKVFDKMCETTELMAIFYKSAFVSCVEERICAKQKVSTNSAPNFRTIRDHAILLADFIDDIISLMFDPNTTSRKSFDLRQIAQAHIHLEPLGFHRRLWILFGESLAEVMFSQDCVRAYPHAASAWSLLSVTVSDYLYAASKKLFKITQMSRSLPSLHVNAHVGLTFGCTTYEYLRVPRRVSVYEMQQHKISTGSSFSDTKIIHRNITEHSETMRFRHSAPDPEFPFSMKKISLGSGTAQFFIPS
uniref:Globin family profile domain-containing protein n=1 Tax=Setaria digitata TaxID=48799 RepID=A0A915PPG9_9BILA